MRSLRLALTLTGALAVGGCFQMTTVVSVNGDGSGTIDHQMLLTKAMLAQLQQFTALAGARGQRLDLTSEDQARAMASNLGPGVTYVSSTPIDNADGQGRATRYAFTDVTQLKISQQPEPPGGVAAGAQAPPSEATTITCSMTHEANGNAVLRIHLPEMHVPGVGGDAPPGAPPMAQQLAMVRSLLAGARVLIAVEPAGRLVRTNSPYVDGSRVTLVDVHLDELLGNEALLARLGGVKTPDELKAVLKDAPGVKVTLDREVTIEFTPAK